ncbi:MAG: hypothetical protein JJT78_01190 [Leptospira sp.]|nr:hypothetical protein [Leptospira sp.]
MICFAFAIPLNLSAQEEFDFEKDEIKSLKGVGEEVSLAEPYSLDWDKGKVSWDGVLFPGYEFVGRNEIGDLNPPSGYPQNSGFVLPRAIINFRGKMKEGKFKNWRYRISLDSRNAAGLGSGCSDDPGGFCQERNLPINYLRYAYLNVPVANNGRTSLRFGIQNNPLTNAQSRISLQEKWEHRYVARSSLRELGLASRGDTGVSLIHDDEYFAFHFMVANGEGTNRNNAERVFSDFTEGGRNRPVRQLNQGNRDSYGMSFSGVFSLIPTGNNKKHEVSINFPFQYDNFAGARGDEVRYASMNLCRRELPTDPNDQNLNSNTPQEVCSSGFAGADYSLYQGGLRAKQDYYYGIETVYSWMQSVSSRFTVGAGSTVKVDRRATAIRIDNELIVGTAPENLSNVRDYIAFQRDQIGLANYIYGHFQKGVIGAFARYTIGTTDRGRLNGELGGVAAESWLTQATWNAWENDGVANLDAIDHGKGLFRSIVIGATYHYSEDLRISFGVSQITATQGNGRRVQRNPLERIPAGINRDGGSLSEQLESSAVFYANQGAFNNLGYNSPGQFRTNDWFGRNAVDRQVFLRAQFYFGGAVDSERERL